MVVGPLGRIEYLASQKEVARTLGISVRWVKRLVHDHPELFTPRYGRRGSHARLHRLYNGKEVQAIADLLTRGAYPGRYSGSEQEPAWWRSRLVRLVEEDRPGG